jgi:hypothetical protein
MVVSIRVHFDDVKINMARKMISRDSSDAMNKKIMMYYKKLGKLVAHEYNENNAKLNKLTNGAFVKPTISVIKTKLLSNNSLSSSLDSTKSNVDRIAAQFTDSILAAIVPPSIVVDFSFNMEKDEEKVAIKLFKKESLAKGAAKGLKYNELKTLFYSTEILNFVNDIKELLKDKIYWKEYTKKHVINKKFVPESEVGNIVVTAFK